MITTNSQSGTNIDEVANGIYRINTPVSIPGSPGGFSFNQYLVRDEQPLLYHTGPRKMFSLVREAVASVIKPSELRYVALSHVEADECGSLNEWLTVAPKASPVCGLVAAMVSINDMADRAPQALADGEILSTGAHQLRWFETPHLPHAWDCGHLFDETTKTLFCGDLFTQGGAKHPSVTESDILDSSEAFRHAMDYYSHTINGRALLNRLADTAPSLLACMHGSAWRGDGAVLLHRLAQSMAD